MTTTEKTTGLASGNMICKNILNSPAPSNTAASYSSSGSLAKNSVSMKTGMDIAVPRMRMTDANELIRFISCINKKSGTIDNWTGNIIPSRKNTLNGRLNLNWYLPNPYATMDDRNINRRTLRIKMIKLLKK